MIRVLLIDDENHCIITLTHALQAFPSIEIVGQCTDSTVAKALIEEIQPDIVFLDIEMPEMNGFTLLEQFETIPFKLVFTTAYDQYALKALRMNALDYLLKPISAQDLEEVLEKYEALNVQDQRHQLQNLQLFREGKMKDTMALSTQNGLLFVKIDEIMYLEASSCYTYIVMQDKTKHLASKTLSVFEEVLQDNSLFFRAHKSHIVNLKFIKQYIRGEGGDLIMQDGHYIALSRNRKQDFLNLFKKV